VSYAVKGEQYVAVVIGAGGSAGLNFSLVPYENAGYVAAFKLGGKAALPPRKLRAPGIVDAPPATASAADIERGRVLYHQWCMFCHGIGTKSGGLLPDLRFAKRDVYAQWQDIVIAGVRADRGMPSFADSLSREDAELIRAYVISQAHREPTLLESAGEWLYEQGACVPARWVAD